MANRTYAVHTSEENIKRVDQHAKRIRRSRNSLLNEAIEMLLETLDSDHIQQIDKRAKKVGK